ncbi:MAG: hypothetical protein KBT00_07805 [Bacteroidales bacterium]|nr:hypothetical protein [Candidatus Cacconaster merdequi]
MKKQLSILAAFVLASLSLFARERTIPDAIRVEGGSMHVQGIAFDRDSGYLYLSFTSAFYKTDLAGNLVGSIEGLNGHLGAMTFDSESRKVYASLELKDDSIGRNISEKLGEKAWTRDQSAFYVAEIDVDKVKSTGIRQEDAITLHLIQEAVDDYKASVSLNDTLADHRFACSGIDGVTIGPAFGSKSCNPSRKYLYVAYGIYGDTRRSDNDYNILLCYPIDKIGKLHRKYFIHTGNTTWGVQNLAYDPYTGKMFLAVYKGRKSEFPNYDLFALDLSQKPFREHLEGVPYFKDKARQLQVSEAWHFKWGSTGLCPLGDGYFFISENGSENGSQYCKATLYRWTGDSDKPFTVIQ